MTIARVSIVTDHSPNPTTTTKRSESTMAVEHVSDEEPAQRSHCDDRDPPRDRGEDILDAEQEGEQQVGKGVEKRSVPLEQPIDQAVDIRTDVKFKVRHCCHLP